jgi:hypothetical protein
MTITLTREEAHQLLVALQELNRLSIGENAICLPAEIDDAMEVLEARLAQTEPDIVQDAFVYGTGITKDGKRIDPASIYKEPVAWLHSFTGYGWHVVPEKLYPTDQPLYTAPPQREWQGLTGEELQEIYQSAGTVHFKFAMVEAKLKEKNT